MRSAILFLLVAIAGCSPAREIPRAAPVSARTVALVSDSLAAAASADARRAAAARRLAAAGVTPLADGQFDIGVGVPLIGGFVPGRHPLGRPQMVILGGSLASPDAAVVLEVARSFVARAEENVPERTLLVALWDGETSGANRIADVLTSPLWPRSAVVSVVVVGESLATDAIDGVPVVAVPSEASPVVLAMRVDEAVARATVYRPPALPDSTR